MAPRYIGKASGAFTTMRQLGGAFGVVILVAVFVGAGSHSSAQAFTDGFAPAIGVSAGLSPAERSPPRRCRDGANAPETASIRAIGALEPLGSG